MPKKIQSKILTVILVTAILPIGCFGAMSFAVMSNMSKTAIDLSGQMSSIAEAQSSEMIAVNIRTHLTEVASLRAQIVDKDLERAFENALSSFSADSDFTIDDVIKSVGYITVGQNGYAFLLDSDGKIISAPKTEQTTDENVIFVGADLKNSAVPAITELSLAMTSKTHGIKQLILDGEDVFVAFSPLRSADWSIGIVLPVSEVYSPVTEMHEEILLIRQSTESEMEYARKAGLVAVLAAVAAAMILALALSFRFAEKISTPIKTLTEDVKKIGGGDLERIIDVKTGDEIEELGGAFNAVLAELKIYINDFKRVTADKNRIMSELGIAKQIQSSVIPHFFTPFPGETEFDIVGNIEPSKEVGGDFYDFFWVDEHKFAVVSADVSSKGVPAALFMVMTKTLIKNIALLNKSPEQIFTEVNNILCENNESGMFVMAFMGILDTQTGVFEFVNAGHYPPLIKRAESDWEFMKIAPGFVLAANENVNYKSDCIKLSKGDKIYIYTGVTEAFNLKFERYGRERFLKVLNGCKDKSIYEIVKISRADISDFICGVEQEDDITLLLLEYFNKEGNGEKNADI
jgi:sigma-B regulation protein RsbU (phosphoserine phosphatase)